MDWKPSVCWQLPIRVDWEQLDGGRERATVRRWSRADWGDEGEQMAWCCTEGERAYVGDRPVIESLADELTGVVGTEVYVELRRRLGGPGAWPDAAPTAGTMSGRLSRVGQDEWSSGRTDRSGALVKPCTSPEVISSARGRRRRSSCRRAAPRAASDDADTEDHHHRGREVHHHRGRAPTTTEAGGDDDAQARVDTRGPHRLGLRGRLDARRPTRTTARRARWPSATRCSATNAELAKHNTDDFMLGST